ENEKRERLGVLHDIIGLPYDKPTTFSAIDLATKNKAFSDFLTVHGDELCALRIIPTAAGLPKLRMRGKTIREAYEWFLKQDIDPQKYKVDIIPPPEVDTWGTIFIVNKHGIQGEIIAGGHH